ncbi:hypothetical protein B0H13DRAFT_796745 [Mycena leptocephala]|nr:hypothetical protein B0H13DRAFT_796745 [Mycena leptocephala]
MCSSTTVRVYVSACVRGEQVYACAKRSSVCGGGEGCLAGGEREVFSPSPRGPRRRRMRVLAARLIHERRVAIIRQQRRAPCVVNRVRVIHRRAPRPARVPRVLRAVDGRGAAVVGVAATATDPILVVAAADPVPGHRRRVHRRRPRLRLRERGLVLPVQRALALERRVRKHRVPVVHPRVVVPIPVSRPHHGSRDPVRAHLREGERGSGGGYEGRLRVVYERLRVHTVARRVVHRRVGVSIHAQGWARWSWSYSVTSEELEYPWPTVLVGCRGSQTGTWTSGRSWVRTWSDSGSRRMDCKRRMTENSRAGLRADTSPQ